MPIRPENRGRYPAHWNKIRERILARAGNRCEGCGVPNHTWITRTADGWDPSLQDEDGAVFVVLTIAHLDHTPEHCADDNLRAWCQRCHNSYDMPMRARGRRERAERTAGVRELPGIETTT